MSNSETPRTAGRPWSGLVWTSCVLSTATALVLLLYGTKMYGAGSLLFLALSFPFFLGGITSGLVLHAEKMRRKLVEIRQWRRPEWGENAENPYEIEFDQQKIVHFWVFGIIPTLVVLLGTGLTMWYKTAPAESVAYLPTGSVVLFSILLAASSAVWLMLASSLSSAVREQSEAGREDSELRAVGECAREFCWWSGLIAAGLVVANLFPSENPQKTILNVVEVIFSWVALWWTLAVTVEFLVRLFLGWLTTRSSAESFSTPASVFLRNIVFVRGNPVASFFYVMEQKCGVSFRSSWAIRFVARSIVPAFALAALVCWGLTSLFVVRLNEVGVRRNCGEIDREILQPGLHWKLPYPFGTIDVYPVKRVSHVPIGFEQLFTNQFSYIWTKEHGEEFEMVLGTGNDSVVVNAIVLYKIREDEEGFFNYVLKFQNSEEAISGYAHRCLTELTRSSRLDEVLTARQDQFAEEIHTRLQRYLDENEMGIEVVEVSILNLHPPVKVAESYLDVISAQIDAKRVVVQAEGVRQATMFQAEAERNRLVAQARIDGAVQVANAGAETSSVLAAGRAFDVNPQCYQFRYWLDNLEGLLRDKRLILVDESVEVLFDMQKYTPGATPERSGFIRAQ